MNTGAFGENFPYSNFHDLNMDWIIKIAKDFLDQYTHIQEIITNGEQSLSDITAEGLEQLQTKADALEALLQQWYNTHSEDIANQLTQALADLNSWYTTHQGYLDQYLEDSVASFNQQAEQKARETIATIPNDYTNLSTDVNNEILSRINLSRDNVPFEYLTENYLYRRGIYINDAGEEITNPATDIYRIPLKKGEAIIVKFDIDNPFWGTTPSIAFKLLETNGTYTKMWGSGEDYYFRLDFDQCFAANMISDHTALSVMILHGNENLLTFYKISLKHYKDDIKDTILLSENNAIKSRIYWTPGSGADGTASLIGEPFYVYLIKMRKGDQLHFNGHIPTVDYYADEWRYTDRTYLRIYDRDFVATDNEIVSVFAHPNVPNPCVYIPKEEDNEYNGKQGVAFGTSLTERGANNNGYLKYLPIISGTTIENAGDSGGTILRVDDGSQWPCILDRILNYTDFSSKQFCILEGFVNDWNLNPDLLGHYTDTGTTSVCGCVRTAINRIYSQNHKISLYLVLDHYGRQVSGSDISSTATRGTSNVTQFEYYEEIRKVAESLGVPVIKEYADSQISENTPEYLVDQVHCTDRGALQSARTILKGMKQHIPNV